MDHTAPVQMLNNARRYGSMDEMLAAEAELRRREHLCCAVLAILFGPYVRIANKRRIGHVYSRFSSTDPGVRRESMLQTARTSFGPDDGDVLCTALAGVLRDLMDVPESVTLEDMKNRPLREVCGLSASHPVFIGAQECYDEIAQNDDNVDAIIGTALKAELARHVGWS